MSKNNGYGIASVRVDIMTKQMQFSIQEALMNYLDKQKDALSQLVKSEISEMNINAEICRNIKWAVENVVSQLISNEMNDVIKKIAKSKIKSLCVDIIKDMEKITKSKWEDVK